MFSVEWIGLVMEKDDVNNMDGPCNQGGSFNKHVNNMTLVRIISQKLFRYLGHVIRKDSLENLTLTRR